MAKLRVLTEKERDELSTQFDKTPDPSESFAPSGEHWILIAILNKLGFYPFSREQALTLANDLLLYLGEQNEYSKYESIADAA